jgi:hypothetical protein
MVHAFINRLNLGLRMKFSRSVVLRATAGFCHSGWTNMCLTTGILLNSIFLSKLTNHEVPLRQKAPSVLSTLSDLALNFVSRTIENK